jgi:hypothetical protein
MIPQPNGFTTISAMNLESDISLERFERWVSRLALFLLVVSPLQLASAMMFFSGNRIFAIAYTVSFFLVALILKCALGRFKTNIRLALLFVEVAFYVAFASIAAAFVQMFLTEEMSKIKIAFCAANVVLIICMFFLIKTTIDAAKRTARLSSR